MAAEGLVVGVGARRAAGGAGRTSPGPARRTGSSPCRRRRARRRTRRRLPRPARARPPSAVCASESAKSFCQSIVLRFVSRKSADWFCSRSSIACATVNRDDQARAGAKSAVSGKRRVLEVLVDRRDEEIRVLAKYPRRASRAAPKSTGADARACGRRERSVLVAAVGVVAAAGREARRCRARTPRSRLPRARRRCPRESSRSACRSCRSPPARCRSPRRRGA